MDKPKNELCLGSLVARSPSIGKLFKEYKRYIFTVVPDLQPIMSLENFYWAMRKEGKIARSRTFEVYLKELAVKMRDEYESDYDRMCRENPLYFLG